MTRTYLDWNATTPLHPDARVAMQQGFDLLGNPSSVHAEGRAAKMALERAREDIATAIGADASDVVFTSGATEAAALLLEGRDLDSSAVEHDAVLAWTSGGLTTDADGRVHVPSPATSTLQLANSETGVIQKLPQGLAVSDLTQGFGRIPFAFDWSGITAGFVSAHKLGGPKGIGAVILRKGTDLPARLRGGGQEQGRRAGTENLIGALGFAAAAKAAIAQIDAGIPQKLSELRNGLEQALENGAGMITFLGRESERLPNTLCVLTPGWKGETQVMQMDLAGFSISAGSACSSGKVRPSGVLTAMGISDKDAACAIRVSIGATTTAEELNRFASAWLSAYDRWCKRRNDRDSPAGG